MSDQESPGVKCIQDLPPEIEEMIMGYLSPPDIMAFGATCSRYHKQTQNRWVWRKVCSHMQVSEPSEWQRSAILKYTQALHYQKLGPFRYDHSSTTKAVNVPKAYGYQRVVPVQNYVLLWDYHGTLLLLRHDSAEPGSMSKPFVLCSNVMDFAVDSGNKDLADHVYVLRRPEYGSQKGPQNGHRGTSSLHIFFLDSIPRYIMRVCHASQTFTKISVSGSLLHRKVLLLCDTGQVVMLSIREFRLHVRHNLFYEPVTTEIFMDEDPLPIQQVYSSQKSTLYLSVDGTVHLEVYCPRLLKKMFGKTQYHPAMGTPELLPLPTKVVKCSLGPKHLCLVDEGGGLFTQGYNFHGQLGTGDKVDRAQLTEMAVSMIPVDVWCAARHTLVLLKDESGHKELHGCGSGLKGCLPGHPKGSNVLVKLNVQVPRDAHSICVVKDYLYIVSSHDITEPERTYNCGPTHKH